MSEQSLGCCLRKCPAQPQPPRGPPQCVRCLEGCGQTSQWDQQALRAVCGRVLPVLRAALTSSWGVGLWGGLECTLKLLDQQLLSEACLRERDHLCA